MPNALKCAHLLGAVDLTARGRPSPAIPAMPAVPTAAGNREGGSERPIRVIASDPRDQRDSFARCAQAIVLACNEIELLIGDEDRPIPVIDSTYTHATAAVDARSSGVCPPSMRSASGARPSRIHQQRLCTYRLVTGGQ